MRWSSAAAALVAIGSFVSPAYAQGDQTERFTRTVRLGANGRFSLDNLSGSITVTGGSSEDVSIEAVKRTRGDRRELDGVRIEVESGNGRVSVHTIYPRDRGGNPQLRGVSVDYTVTVPAGAETELNSVSGAVGASNIRGVLRIQNVSGRVSIARVERLDVVKSVSGPIDVAESRLRDRAEFSVVGGRISVRNVSAPALELKGISGALEVLNSVIDRLTASVISGNVEFNGALPSSARYDLNTHSGSVRLSLPADAQFEVNAATLSGPIRFAFPGTVPVGRAATVVADHSRPRRGPAHAPELQRQHQRRQTVIGTFLAEASYNWR